MSTKLHNGYSLPQLTLTELQAGIQELRQAMTKIALQKQKLRQISLAIEILDRQALGLTTAFYPLYWKADKLTTRTPMSVAYDMTRTLFNRVKKEGLREPSDDYSCDIAILPAQNKILCLLFAEDEKFHDQLTTKKWFKDKTVGFTPYAYWNNSDPEDGVTEAEWSARGQDWNKALPTGIPAQDGLHADLVPVNIYPVPLSDYSPEELPSAKQRALDWAREILLDSKVKETVKPDAEMHECMRSLSDASEWLRTSEGQIALQAKAADLQTKLLTGTALWEKLKTPLA